MKAMREAPNAAERKRLKAKFEELISRAEQLRRPSRLALPGPSQSRELPTSEKTILLRSSRLHGNVFPPWEAEPTPETFKRSAEGELYR